MITVDNYEVELSGSFDTITEDLRALVKYFNNLRLYELHSLIIWELKERDAKNNTSD